MMKKRNTTQPNKRREVDVGLRSRSKGRLGRRVLSLGTRSLFWIFVIAGLIAGVWVTTRGAFRVFFADNPHFTLEELNINTWSQVAHVQVKAILSKHDVVPEKTTLYDFDIDDVKRELEGQLLITDVTIERRFPDTLYIKLRERRPVAQWRTSGGLLLDKEGWLLPRLDGDFVESLPIITGGSVEYADKPGQKVTDSLVQAALRFLELMSLQTGRASFDISIIQLDYANNVLLVHVQGDYEPFRKSSQIVFPPDNLEQALKRAQAIIKERGRAQQTISFMDVTYRQNIPVRP